MNAYETWTNDDAWQAVVDGELTPSQLRELVTICDRHPELWRRCAIAFLEEQAFEREMKSIEWPAAAAIRSVHNLIHEKQAGPLVQVEQSQSQRMPTSDGDGMARLASNNFWQRHANLFNNVALAATILLAFVIGWQSSLRFGAKENSTLVERSLQPSTIPDSNLASTSAGAIESALDRPEELVSFERTIPKEIAELIRLGVVDVKSNDGFVPVRLEDGNAAIVPFHRYQVHPVKMAY